MRKRFAALCSDAVQPNKHAYLRLAGVRSNERQQNLRDDQIKYLACVFVGLLRSRSECILKTRLRVDGRTKGLAIKMQSILKFFFRKVCSLYFTACCHLAFSVTSSRLQWAFFFLGGFSSSSSSFFHLVFREAENFRPRTGGDTTPTQRPLNVNPPDLLDQLASHHF